MAIFRKSFLLIFIPLFILWLPLLFHACDRPTIGRYNNSYFIFVLSVFGWIMITALASAYLSKTRQNMRPAYILLAFIISLALVCFISETILRIKYDDNFIYYRQWGHKKSIIFGFEAQPNNRWEKVGAVYTTDSLGFRVYLKSPHWQNIENSLRIFALGGSSVFGQGLNDDQTWPYKLETLLRNRLADDRICVVNAGNNGHNSLQILLRFYLKVLPHKPTHIIFYENVNDIDLNKLGEESLWINEDILFSRTVYDYWAAVNRKKSFYARSLLYNYLINSKRMQPWSDIRSTAASYKTNREHNGKRYIKNIKTLAIICKANNIELILVTFIHSSRFFQRDCSQAVKYYNYLLRDLAQKEGLFLIDLEKEFEDITAKDEYFFPDKYHPNLRGVEFIASHIAKAIVERGLLKIRQESIN